MNEHPVDCQNPCQNPFATYDEIADVLYLSLPPGPSASSCIETSMEVLVRKSLSDGSFSGMTIVDWKAQCLAALKPDDLPAPPVLEADWVRARAPNAVWQARNAGWSDEKGSPARIMADWITAALKPDAGEVTEAMIEAGCRAQLEDWDNMTTEGHEGFKADCRQEVHAIYKAMLTASRGAA